VLVRRRATNCAAAVAALLTPDASAARRIAAISTLGTIGGPDQLAVLIAAAQDADMAVAGAARNALAACPHPGMPAAIGQHLASASEPARTRLALAGAVHRVEAALTHLIPLAGTTGDQAEQARTMLGRHAGPNQYAALARLITAGNGDDGIERMWSELLKRSVDQEAATRILITTHDASRGPARATCMRLLGGIGSSAALATVVKDLHDSDATTVDAAVRALANWSEVEAVPQLLAIATTRDDQTHRTLALRGIVRLAEKPGRTTAQQLDTLRQAWTAVKRPDDVRLLLGAVGRIPSLDALALLEPRIADAAVQDEAVTAWLGIARALDKAKQKTQAVQALDRLIAATSGPLQERAQAEKALLAGNGKGKK
jgi:HEAT repeat protein